MGLHAIQYTEKLQTLACCGCGVQFAIPESLEKNRRDDHKTFHCPNGHPNYFPAKTEAEKLKEDLAKEKQRREMAEREAAMEARRAINAQNELARVQKRVKNGVCPCCNRTFQNLHRHMKTKHPDHQP
jgi:DNA repair exonuclease SbcCD ATPase subunit